jgi:hypothetical protein
MKRLALTIVAAAFALGSFGWAGQGVFKTKDDESKGPITIEIKSQKDSYKLDLGGKTGKEYLEILDKASKDGSDMPKPPAVDFEITIKNTGKEKVEFWASGDPVRLELEIKGPGARTLPSNLAFTANFIMPKLSPLEPGKTHKLTLKSLQSGMRGAGTYHYWAEPGEYTIIAHYRTGISPAPKGSEVEKGVGKVTLASAPIKVKVEK